ncbi:MAG: hypothetical protein ACRD2T_08890, partial [Thermoanaerobaculia bacterium]
MTGVVYKLARGLPLVFLASAVAVHGAAADSIPRADKASAAELGLRPGERLDEERIRDLYKSALALWAAGDEEGAAVRLMAVEAAVVREGDIEARKALLAAEEKVVQELAATSLEVLVPMAVLHHEVYRRHIDQGERRHLLLTAHSRSMARDLAVLYERHSGTDRARGTAALLLNSLGGYLLDAAQQLLAGQMFTLATSYDPRSIPGHLGLAVIYEKNGQYDTAIGSLRSALAVDPMQPQALLRLGVNLRRTGKGEEAARVLRPLTGLPGWIGGLAVQELAAMQVEARNLAPAEAVLRGGLERFPQEGAIYLQLAAVLDRQGKAVEGREVMS